MKFFDLQHPFYKPLWIRALITALCLGWAVLEFTSGNPGWGTLFGGIGLIAARGFFFGFDPEAIRARAEEEAKKK